MVIVNHINSSPVLTTTQFSTNNYDPILVGTMCAQCWVYSQV